MTTLDRDRSIIAQVAAKIAAETVGLNDFTHFDATTAHVFETIVALGAQTPAQAAVVAQQTAAQNAVGQAPVAPVAQVAEAFPGAQVVAPPAPQAPVAAAPQGGVPRIRKQGPWPLPEWLESQLASSKVTPGEELWDNRKDLAMFGGTKTSNIPWFKGVDSGEGVWPPKG